MAIRQKFFIFSISLFSFLIISTIYFGYGGLHSLNQTMVGDGGTDKLFYIWCFRWWPHALWHGLNPFYTHVAWFPAGFNLTKTTPIPGIALLSLPLTYFWGPIVAYNIIALITPGLAAWTMFILCRYLVGETLPALFGGYVFGFCSYEIDHMLGHLNLTAPIFLLPLFIYFSVLYVNHKLVAKYFILVTTLCVTLLFSISTEIYTYYLIFATLGLCISYIFLSGQRDALKKLILLTLIANILTALIISPYLYYFFFDLQHDVRITTSPSPDLLKMIIPSRLFLVSNHQTADFAKFLSPNLSEHNTYLGLPLILVMLLFWKQFSKYSFGKALLCFTLVVVVFSVGPELKIATFNLLIMPWNYLYALPVIHYILIARIGLVISLSAALMLAIWLAKGETPWYLRYALAVLVIVFLLPSMNAASRARVTNFQGVPFFNQHLYANYLHMNDNVFIIKGEGDAALWQVQSRFYFNIANGIVGIKNSKNFINIMLKALSKDNMNLKASDFKRFIKEDHIDVILIKSSYLYQFKPLLDTLGIQAQDVGGIQLYRVTR